MPQNFVQHFSSAPQQQHIKQEQGWQQQSQHSAVLGSSAVLQQQQQQQLPTQQMQPQQQRWPVQMPHTGLQQVAQQHQQPFVSHPAAPSVLPGSQQQQQEVAGSQQQQHIAGSMQQQQQMPQIQSELHQLHEQFARAPDDAALPAALFSDNLGCDDIIPPPPGLTSNTGHAAASLRAAGIAPGAGGLQRCQPQVAGGVSTAAAGHNSAGILSELESIKGPAMVSTYAEVGLHTCISVMAA
jgi:hypothetical protein